MANDLSMMKAYSVGRPWVLGIQNQVVSYCGVGVCDPLLQNSVSALEPYRYDTTLFQWALAGDAGGGDLQIATGQERELFTGGVGETISGGWWTKTISDTDLFRSGAPVDRGFMFLVTGLTVNALDVFQRGGTGASAADPKLYASWLSGSENGPGYGFLIQKFHINYTSLEVKFGDTGCSYRVGVAGFWPSFGDPAGAQTVRNGLTATPGMYLPLTTAVCIGARDDVKQLTLTLKTGQSGVVQNNPASPTLNIANDGSPETPGSGDVFAPVRTMTIGYLVCVPFENYCGIPTLTADEVLILRQRLGLQPVGEIPG